MDDLGLIRLAVINFYCVSKLFWEYINNVND